MLNLDQGALAVRAMIKSDIRRFGEMGAMRYAADLEVVSIEKIIRSLDDTTEKQGFIQRQLRKRFAIKAPAPPRI